ncbi:MAG TPA: hypothetical protein VFY84_14170 [Jiangellales bacterium]|nr:hypothetical protein [Jiangellales bacterium]
MTRMEQLEQAVRGLADDQACPVCGDEGLIPCPDHMTVTAANGWCALCDSPDPDQINCPCLDGH